jgi:7,8-dihydro-6-hydroxymethylpterin-pyrophosphokinase
VDILYMEGVELAEPDLQIPHPRMRERRFVLVPLKDIAPDLVDADDLVRAEGQVKRFG